MNHENHDNFTTVVALENAFVGRARAQNGERDDCCAWPPDGPLQDVRMTIQNVFEGRGRSRPCSHRELSMQCNRLHKAGNPRGIGAPSLVGLAVASRERQGRELACEVLNTQAG
jgi:hypothetical protein